jgi:shikimate kinase
MKIENPSLYDEHACFLNEKSQDLMFDASYANDCLIITMPPPEAMAQWDMNEDSHELKRIVRDLRWTGMISDALVVLAITGAVYFSPSLETMRAALDKTAISVAEAPRAH